MKSVLRLQVAVVLAVWSFGPVVRAADEKPLPAEPTPRMEPAKLGPKTEAVDEKAYAKVLHVAPGGSDQADGSGAKPLATVGAAIAKAGEAGETSRVAVLVAAGEYRGATVEMKPHVDLFGGFDARTWQRDIDANRSVLDGEGQRRVVAGADNARLDGFVVRNGKVRGPGAGVLCDHVAPVISNNTIVGNATQEPDGFHQEMYHQHGNDGAGVACINGAHATVSNNVIANNTTDVGNGGGVAAANWSMPRVVNNVIVNNRTGLTDVKSRSSNGAGVSASNAVIRPPHRMVVANNVVANNYAGGNSDAGGVYCEYDSSPVVAANWVLANFAEDDGSGVYVMKLSQPNFVDNIIAGQSKGAVRISKQGCGEFENNLIFGNGNAITSISAWMSLKNNTIVDNRSGVGHENQYAPYIKPPVVVGNVIYNNGGGKNGLGIAPGVANDTPTVKGNDIEGGYQGAGGEGNFDEPPKFVDDAATVRGVCGGYDALGGFTTIGSVKLPDDARVEPGRVVQLAERWGVVKEVKGDAIVVWGDLRPKGAGSAVAVEVKVAPTYRLKAPLAGGAVGRPASVVLTGE